MVNYLKAPEPLGQKVHQQFCAQPNGVLLEVRSLVLAGDMSVSKRIAQAWGRRDEGSVPRILKNLIGIPANSVHHTAEWTFLLRAAQCAALADRQLSARLVQTEDSDSSELHERATNIIYTLGQGAIGLLEAVMGSDSQFLSDKDHKATEWSKDNRIKVAQLCMPPHVFFRVMRTFAELITPDSEKELSPDNIPAAVNVLYRTTTAALAVGQHLQIDFVPFE